MTSFDIVFFDIFNGIKPDLIRQMARAIASLALGDQTLAYETRFVEIKKYTHSLNLFKNSVNLRRRGYSSCENLETFSFDCSPNAIEHEASRFLQGHYGKQAGD